MPTDELLHTLRALERELYDPVVRCSRERLLELLHQQFYEFGRSGAVYTRAQVIERLLAESLPVKFHTQGFAVLELAPSVVLLTYQSANLGPSGSLDRFANRASVWKREASGWQMMFHQGTPTGPFPHETWKIGD